MKKQPFVVLLFLLLCLNLSSCKMSDYSDALEYARAHKYEDAIELFAELGDYHDSPIQLVDAIENYSADLLEHYHYDELIALYQQYSYVADFSLQMQNAVVEYSEYLLRCSMFADSIAIYSQYSHIADFTMQQQEAIERCVNELLDEDDFATAISIYQQYSSVADYSSHIADLQYKKELFDAYSRALTLLENGMINDGFAILETLPENYRNINEIYTSYETLKDTPFQGSHKQKNPNWTNSQKVEFSLVFLPEYECFCIQADLTVYWSDGSVYSRNTYNGYANNLKDNTLKTGRYTWIVDSSGRITEKD